MTNIFEIKNDLIINKNVLFCVCRAIGFMFIFSTILMFICMLLFLFGGAMQTEACRYLIDEEGLEHSDAVQVRDTL